jgi:hypothetical protein
MYVEVSRGHGGTWIKSRICRPNIYRIVASHCGNWYSVIMDQAILEREALRLPTHQRALLADSLLGSLDDEAARQVEAAWAQEAEARLAAFRRGETDALDGPAVLDELRNRLTK